MPTRVKEDENGPRPVGERDGALQRAQRQANETRVRYGVWEHVGDYGAPHGDVPARHTFKTQPLSKSNPDRSWALIATVEPEQEW